MDWESIAVMRSRRRLGNQWKRPASPNDRPGDRRHIVWTVTVTAKPEEEGVTK